MALGVWTILRGPFTYTPSFWGQGASWIACALEAAEAVLVAYLGYRLRSYVILLCGLGQLGLTVAEEVCRLRNPVLFQAPRFVLDSLSLVLVMIICIVGSFIVIFALSYMKRHEEHAPAGAASNRLFFLFLISFLGFMNGVALSDTIQIFIIFWEATTFCSFALIAHDRTPEAMTSAKRALLITALGGTGNIIGSVISLAAYGAPTITGLMTAHVLVPAAFFCVAALTKSALLPFQSWLLAAMIAPTPVSALLHSATMVKAGVYLILRLAPAFTNTMLMSVLALIGAFSFALAAGLAIGQSNAKRVLAYSTISNLGLIVACAAMNRHLALAAALMVFCFHALSKGLLFLCVGTIEQRIGSRDIEDMGGVRFLMPFTTTITLIGMASMLIPPFGMLLSKWMAIEAAVDSPIILILLVAGSALTVVFWVKWMGRIQTVSYHPEEKREELAAPARLVLLSLAVIIMIAGVTALLIQTYIFEPLVTSVFAGRLAPEAAARALVQLKAVGNLTVWPILLILGLAFVAWRLTGYAVSWRHVRLPFLCGENVEQEGLFYSFYSLKDQPETAWAASLYMTGVFDEGRITPWANLLAGLLVLSLLTMAGQ
ncbi:MAG: proton-conducting transporter membrane subunit [Thermodesulfobacteriota bacterium]